MAVAVLPQLGTRQLMATDGNPWVAAMGEQLVRGSGAGAGMWQWHGSVGVGGAVLLGNVEL